MGVIIRMWISFWIWAFRVFAYGSDGCWKPGRAWWQAWLVVLQKCLVSFVLFFLNNLRRRMVVIPGLFILGLRKIPGFTATMFLGCWLIQTYDLGATKYVALIMTAMPHCIQLRGYG